MFPSEATYLIFARTANTSSIIGTFNTPSTSTGVKTGIIEHHRTTQCIVRFFGGHIDATAQGVFTEVGCLWATQYFDALDVHNGWVGGATGYAEIIHIKSESGRLERIVDSQKVRYPADTESAT